MSISLEHLVGQAIGNCRVEELLHQGRLSAVYRAFHSRQQQPVALTFFLPPAGWPSHIHERFMARFLRESAQLVTVSHPNLLPIYEFGERAGYPFLVTPYVAQGSLANTLQLRGRCAPATAQYILEQVSAALEHAHRCGIIHRSLKLSHIIMPAAQSIQVTGLGLAHLLEKRGILQDGTPFSHLQTIAGTMLVAPKYLAPECILGQEGDMRSDVYALGVILFEMLSGLSPFTNTLSTEAVTQRQQHPLPALHSRFADIPPALDHVLQQALAWEAGMRFQSVRELFSAFSWALQARGALLTPPSTDPLQQAAPAAAGAACDLQQQQNVLCTSCPALPAVHAAGRSPHYAEAVHENASAAADPFAEWPPDAPPMHDERYDLWSSSRPHPAHPRTRRLRSRRRGINRRQALALLMLGGGVAIGAISLKSTNLALLAGEAMHRPASSASPMVAQKKTASSRTTTSKRINQPLNSAQIFTNPKDGKQALLIRLPGGSYVAYERACTHVGVAVNYDPNTHLLVCPAHGSIFDPAHQGHVVKGPAALPLAQVALQTNPDGSVSML